MVSNIQGKFRIFIFLFIVFFTALQAAAQQYYPVQVRGFVQSPSVYLEDYKDPNNFRVQVTVSDFSVSTINLVLNLTFQDPTKGLISTIHGKNLVLAGGETYTLNRSDLDSLLSPSNLTGYTSTLKEGTYMISFKVTEKLSGTTVSNALTDFTTVLVNLFDPPLLTWPAQGALLDPETDGSSIMFSWTPRSFSLSAGDAVKYQLALKEIPEGRNPYDAFKTSALEVEQPFDEIPFNSFTYDPSNFKLIPGHTYAWQVVAYSGTDPNGKLLSGRFRNDGASDIFTFKIKEFCPTLFLNSPVLVSNAQGKQEVKLSWNPDIAFAMFEVKYRPLGSVAPWIVLQQQTVSLNLGETQLIKGQTYEYSVAPKCIGWQDEVYGGTFMLPASDCEAPTPIKVTSNDANGIALNWNPIPAALSYTLRYTNNTSGKDSTLENITQGSALLPKIASGSYTIHVDAVCSAKTAQGEPMSLDWNEQYFAGSCPLPTPFNFVAKRPDTLTTSKYAEFAWPSLDLHESFVFTYWENDSTPTSVPVITPNALEPSIISHAFYNYTIRYVCKGGKSTTTPQAGFRLEDGGGNLNISPPTADCFPPAVHSAEPRSETSARIDWKGVSGAQEYMVLYREKGSTNPEKIFTTTAANARLTNLTAGVTYEYKIDPWYTSFLLYHHSIHQS